MRNYNKKSLFLFLVFGILFFSLVSSLSEPTSPVSKEDIDTINDNVGKVVGEDGKFQNPLNKTKAQERIEKINSYVGPITKTLFGVELELSWIFLYSLLFWITLIIILYSPSQAIFGFNSIVSFIISVILATLSMQSFGDNFVLWINNLANIWWASLTVVLFTIVFSFVIYPLLMKFLGDKIRDQKSLSEEERLKRDRKIIHVDAEISKKRLKGD